ncbi:MAG: hypothetical protein ACXWAT_17295 [Methylobacter sp.]
MKNKLIVAAVCLLFAGCAGSSFKFDSARKVEVGMTEGQLTNLMGSPYSVVSKGDHQIWIWSHANALTGKSQSVSFVMQDGKVISLPTIPKSFD